MSLGELNRDVLIAIGAFAALLYAGMIYAGFTEFVSRLRASSSRRKRTKSGNGNRRLPNAKKTM